MGDRVVTVKPEFDQCRRRAGEYRGYGEYGECGAAVKDVIAEAQAEAMQLKAQINRQAVEES
jgi:hypothetical protein